MELFCHVGLRYVVECFRHAVLVPGFYLILMFLSVSGIQTSNLCVIIILLKKWFRCILVPYFGSNFFSDILFNGWGVFRPRSKVRGYLLRTVLFYDALC